MADSSPDVTVRRARTSDIPRIKHLVDTYAGKILLEKNLVTLYEAVQEFWVAERGNEVIGCGGRNRAAVAYRMPLNTATSSRCRPRTAPNGVVTVIVGDSTSAP